MRSPWFYIPTLYFQQGLPVMMVQQLSVILYKKFGISNDQIGLWTSLIAWPWILKLLWAPLVDLHGKRRNWVLICQVLIVVCLAITGLAITHSHFFSITLMLFFILAFLSATHDVALDGYYLLALRPDEQAFFTGISTTAFRLAMIFCSGVLVMLAGYWEKSGDPVSVSWQNVLFLSAALYAALLIYAKWSMPDIAQDRPAQGHLNQRPSFLEAIQTFFAQPKIIPIILFILLYRIGESMLSKMSGLFLLDPPSAGGLGLSTLQVGMILGNVGMIALIGGGLLGGFVIAQYGLKRCVWPMALIMHIPNLFYLFLARSISHTSVQPSLATISLLTAIDQFAYGFGLASYMVFLMYLCQKSRFPTTHYAIAMGLMSLGASIAGISSGFIQQHWGYFVFFAVVCLSTIPGMILLNWIPLNGNAQNTEDSLEVPFVPAGSH